MPTTHAAQRSPAALATTIAAVVAAVAIALEVLTDPVDNFGHYHRGLALPVNLVLFAAVIVLAVSATALLLERRDALGRAGLVGGLAVIGGFALGDLPHSVVDFTVAPQLFSHLPHEQAKHLLEHHVNSAVGILSAPAILLLLGGFVALGRATLRSGTLPRWAGFALFAGIPGAIVLGALGAASDLAPHPPVALYVALAAWASASRA